MIHDRGLIHFACIATGTTVLAEFNSRDAALGQTATKCLANTPPFHSTFTHTVRSKTYAFLIENPFVYFAIFDEKVENSEGIVFLRSVAEAFGEVWSKAGDRRLEDLGSHCYQGEFNPVFRKLLGGGDHLEVFGGSPEGWRIGGESGSGEIPVRGRVKGSEEKGLVKMKNRLFGRFDRKDNNNDDDGGSGVGLSREFSVVMQKNGGLFAAAVGHQKAKKVWKKHVWVVLSLDLIICLALFAVWLWVCSGFQCIKS